MQFNKVESLFSLAQGCTTLSQVPAALLYFYEVRPPMSSRYFSFFCNFSILLQPHWVKPASTSTCLFSRLCTRRSEQLHAAFVNNLCGRAHCCDRKSRAAYAQSFALWQQATIEFTWHDHSPRTLVVTFNGSQVNIGRASTPRSLFYCLFAPHISGVVLRAHPVRGESHNQRNTTGEVATTCNSTQSICKGAVISYKNFSTAFDNI